MIELKNGYKYVGYFKNDEREDFGTEYFQDQGKRMGCIKQGCAHGIGIRSYLNGEIEIGEKLENEQGRDMNHG